MPYTVRDTPDILARIDRDLQQVTQVVRRGDPGLRSLILTGGFARGEGTTIDGEPQNDYDLVAVRGRGRPKEPYDAMRRRLEERLGLHMDLCAVPSWRLPWVPPSIFWYETQRRGRVLWGAPVLDAMRPIEVADIDPREGLRLLVNRAAGLLLSTDDRMGWDRNIQSAKALLAACDVRLLALGTFPPTHLERREVWDRSPVAGTDRMDEAATRAWVGWAHDHKMQPERHPPDDPHMAWQAAARAILDAVPVALANAGYATLDEYARDERTVEWLMYQRNVHQVDGGRRLVAHPTGRIRHATLRLLEHALDGQIQGPGQRLLQPMVRQSDDALRSLDQLRHATLQ